MQPKEKKEEEYIRILPYGFATTFVIYLFLLALVSIFNVICGLLELAK